MHTTDGRRVGYDALMIALGAKVATALPGAITLRGPGYTTHFGALLRERETGAVKRVAFAVPPGVAWQLPLYELALMTANRLAELGVEGAELRSVTPEAEPRIASARRCSIVIRPA